eukprot:Nk52_evm15s554 gene=Nk52_evmTU15s554
MKIAFVHPDLGIGGAERLVVDAALALKAKGHQVEFYTSHHDPNHCFPETRDGQLKVNVYGDFLPRQILGRFYLLCAIIRMIYVCTVLLYHHRHTYNVFFVDQLSAIIPLLSLFGGNKSKIFFYCHFPDQLLTNRNSILKKLYRWPLDWFEEWTTGLAHRVVVNSKFTGDVYCEQFKSLAVRERPLVVYPSLHTESIDALVEASSSLSSSKATRAILPPGAKTVFLSINRYERKKNIKLAVEAFALLKKRLPDNLWDGVFLVIAGGYDTRVRENVEYHAELEAFAKAKKVTEWVIFVRSMSDMEKVNLLKRCCALLYTPDREHFGIVPLEAMYNQKPVIAVRSGGPLETVYDPKYSIQPDRDYSNAIRGQSETAVAKTNSRKSPRSKRKSVGKRHQATKADAQTGILCEPTAASFAEALEKFVRNPSLSGSYGRAGRERVVKYYSFRAFSDRLNNLISEL